MWLDMVFLVYLKGACCVLGLAYSWGMKGGSSEDLRGDGGNLVVHMCQYEQGVHEMDSRHCLFFCRLNPQCVVPAFC